MLDHGFKSLWVVENYVDRKLDANMVIPLLLMIFEVVNPIVQTCVAIVARFCDFIKKDNNIFDVCASMEKFLNVLVVGELFLFKRLFVILVACIDTLLGGDLIEESNYFE
jgi:hypothetical protein